MGIKTRITIVIQQVSTSSDSSILELPICLGELSQLGQQSCMTDHPYQCAVQNQCTRMCAPLPIAPTIWLFTGNIDFLDRSGAKLCIFASFEPIFSSAVILIVPNLRCSLLISIIAGEPWWPFHALWMHIYRDHAISFATCSFPRIACST
jgi:hypothetical protein